MIIKEEYPNILCFAFEFGIQNDKTNKDLFTKIKDKKKEIIKITKEKITISIVEEYHLVGIITSPRNGHYASLLYNIQNPVSVLEVHKSYEYDSLAGYIKRNDKIQLS